MPKEKPQFITRDMFNFEQGGKFAIQVISICDLAIPINIIGGTKDGTFTLAHTPNADFTAKAETFNLPDIPIWLSVFETTNSFERGELFVRINLVVNGDVVHQLASGYVFGKHGISWPLTQAEYAEPLIGNQSNVSGTNPAAGSEVNTLVPTGEIWKVKGIRLSLVTDANAANRTVQLQICAGASSVVHEMVAGAVQTASLTRVYYFIPGHPPATAFSNGAIQCFLPLGLIMVAGDAIKTVTTNLQAGDDYSLTIYRERYLKESP